MSIEEILDALRRGQWLHAGAADFPEISALLAECADRCHELNLMRPSDVEARDRLLRKILGSAGDRLVINSPFRCDFGFNIHVGDNFIGNFNLSILDEAEVRIGRNVQIGPNCTLITITHALDAEQRNAGVMCARPVTIGDNVWLASNVTVLPGVEIGSGSIIGAGSVVTRSIPSGVVAVGSPCRVLRPVTDADRVEVFSPKRFNP